MTNVGQLYVSQLVTNLPFPPLSFSFFFLFSGRFYVPSFPLNLGARIKQWLTFSVFKSSSGLKLMIIHTYNLSNWYQMPRLGKVGHMV